MRCERLLNVRNAHLNGVKKESVQAACSSELFPSGGAAFGRNQTGMDHPETEGKAGGIGVTGSLAGSSRTEFILRLLEKRGGQLGSQRTPFQNHLQTARASAQSLPFPSNSREEGCRTQGLRGPGRAHRARPPHGTRESGPDPWSLQPARSR